MIRIKDFIGQSPIHPVLLIIGKAAFLVSLFFFPLKMTGSFLMMYDGRLTSTIGIIMAAAGFCLILTALLHLGESVAVGIPDRKTVLKTRGLYNFTRNPIYLSGFLMCSGSCLFAVHWINFVSFTAAVVIHHAIIKKEEEFLEKTFGSEWLEYKKRVPRYLIFL